MTAKQMRMATCREPIDNHFRQRMVEACTQHLSDLRAFEKPLQSLIFREGFPHFG
jgi:hypothetical protein